MEYKIPNFKRDKKQYKKILSPFHINLIMIILAVLLLCLITFVYTNKANLNKESYRENISSTKCGEYLLEENTLSKFISNGKLYYSFDANINNEITSYYLPESYVSVYTNNSCTENKIVVYHAIYNQYDYDKVSRKFETTKNCEEYYYEIYLIKDTKITDMGEINLESKQQNNSFVVFPFFFPVYM